MESDIFKQLFCPEVSTSQLNISYNILFKISSSFWVIHVSLNTRTRQLCLQLEVLCSLRRKKT